jgi:cell division protein FtsW (lipid II flippase)
MKNNYYVIASLILMVFGEILTIYSEVYASKLPGRPMETPEMFIKPMVLICIAGISLVFAYWLGYQGTGNIWVVTVASLTLLLILEPIVIYVMLKELPQRGALIGFILGAAGLVSTVAL